jgi:hypothetical protein
MIRLKKIFLRLRTYNESAWEARVERNDALQIMHLFIGKTDVERLDVGQEMFNLAAPDYRETVWNLRRTVSEREPSFVLEQRILPCS